MDNVPAGFARVAMEPCVRTASDAIDIEHRRDVVVLQQDLLARDAPVSLSKHELVLRAPEERVALARARKEDVAHPGRVKSQPIRRRLYRKNAPKNVSSARHGSRSR